MLVLGLETSCDETGVALYDSERGLLADALFSQIDLHRVYGGVVPELASRDHVKRMLPLIRQVLAEADCVPTEIDAIAYTAGPGLVGALLVGASCAQALAFAWGIPALGVHHMEGHLLAPMLESQPPEFPFVALLVSGGHTQLVQVDGIGQYELLGESLDDAAGEAFDKIARVMGLGFPGGPAVDLEAKNGDANAINFPRGLTQAEDWRTRPYDFSFSGLKTAVARYLEATPNYARADVAASFQEAIVDVLLLKAVAACKQTGIYSLVIAGGVAANSRLRAVAQERCEKAGIQLRVPSPGLCTDNGAMVAALGSLMVSAGRTPSPVAFDADSSLPVTTVSL